MDPRLDPGGIRALHTERRLAGQILLSLVFTPPLTVFAAAGLWLVWTLAEDAFGRQAAALVVLGLLLGTFAISQRTSRVFNDPLIRIAWAGLAVPIWVVFGMVGYTFVFGGRLAAIGWTG
jgi:hypothetical protein